MSRPAKGKRLTESEQARVRERAAADSRDDGERGGYAAAEQE